MFRIAYAVFMSMFWWWLALIAFIVGYVSVARATHPEEIEIRAALQENFDAYNREDVKGIMATLSPTLPRRAEFESQAVKVFKDADAYISVRGFELLEVKGQYAMAYVVQGTVVGDGLPEPTPDDAFYRQKSKLLPSEAEVEYVQSFKKERGKWRLWLTISEPKKPYVGYTDDGVYRGPGATEINRKNGIAPKSQCPGGNCSFPRVRVTAR